jgi:TonB-linked SusC/RagA family outer membrane protein
VLNTKININAQQKEVKTILSQISKMANVKFVYSAQKVPAHKIVSLQANEEKLADVLQKLLAPLAIGYDVSGKQIILIGKNNTFPKPEEITVNSNTEIIKGKEISGKVTDENGHGLSNVSVLVKGTSKGAITNENGDFTIVANEGDVLTVSLVGYTAKEVIVAKKTALLVTLTASANSLEQVVVVGYGTQKKVNLTGSVNTVNTHDIVNRPTTSLTNSLQGMVPGMTIIARPGDVGGDIGSINIRGRGNLGTSEPLYIVDGVPVSSSTFARITPSDVESLSILKDAASSAIYGSRAAYGVILITTKKGGKSGKMVVNYNAYYGSQKALVLPNYVGSYQYALLRNEAAENAGKSDVYSQAQLNTIKTGSSPDSFPDNNWYKLALHNTAPLWENELNVSGGGKTRYYISGSVMKQGSLVPGKDLTRYSLRSNTESQVSDIFKVGTNISYIRDDYNMTGGDISFTALNRTLPLTVNKQSDGSWGSITGGKIDATHANGNMVRYNQEGGRSSNETDRFLGSLTGNLQPVKGLSIDGMLSYNFTTYTASSFLNQMTPLINFATKQPIASTA